jgi:hypothetical protein
LSRLIAAEGVEHILNANRMQDPKIRNLQTGLLSSLSPDRVGGQFPRRAVKPIRPAFVDHVGDGTASASILRSIRVSQNGHFADGFRIGRLKGLSIDCVVVVVLSIDEKIVGSWTRAIYCKIDPVAYSAISGILNTGRSAPTRLD